MGTEIIHLISAYEPDASKSKEGAENFYDILQTEIDRVPGKDGMILTRGPERQNW